MQFFLSFVSKLLDAKCATMYVSLLSLLIIFYILFLILLRVYSVYTRVGPRQSPPHRQNLISKRKKNHKRCECYANEVCTVKFSTIVEKFYSPVTHDEMEKDDFERDTQQTKKEGGSDMHIVHRRI